MVPVSVRTRASAARSAPGLGHDRHPADRRGPTPAPGSPPPTTPCGSPGAAPGHPGRTPPDFSQFATRPSGACGTPRRPAPTRRSPAPALQRGHLDVPGPPFRSTCRRTTARRLPVSTIADGVGLNITVMSYQKNLDVGLIADGPGARLCGPHGYFEESWASCSARWRSMTAEAIAPGEEVEDAYGPRPVAPCLEWRAGSSTGRCSPATRRCAWPHGDGHPVLVLPGFTAGDRTTRLCGPTSPSSATPPTAGARRQPRPDRTGLGAAARALADLGDNHGEPVSLIAGAWGDLRPGDGAPLAGLRAPGAHPRLALQPGAPPGHPRTRLYRPWPGSTAAAQLAHAQRVRARPLPVPATSIYSRTDGVVAWQSCLQEPTGATRTSRSGQPCRSRGEPGRAVHSSPTGSPQSAGQWEPYRPMSTIARFLPPLRPYPG